MGTVGPRGQNPKLHGRGMKTVMKTRMKIGTMTRMRVSGAGGSATMTQNNQIVGQGSTIAATNCKQALQQLMETLKNPQNPDQPQQIRSILQSNPQLMTAFINQRAVITIANLSLSRDTKYSPFTFRSVGPGSKSECTTAAGMFE